MGLESNPNSYSSCGSISLLGPNPRIYGDIMKIEKWVDDIEDEVLYKYVYTKPEDRGYAKAPITAKQFYAAVPSFNNRNWLGRIVGTRVDVYYKRRDGKINLFYAEETASLFGKILLILFMPIVFLYVVFTAGFGEFVEAYRDVFWTKTRGTFMAQTVTQSDTKAFDKLMSYYVDYTR